jgi:predicted transcriptional regulator
VTCDEQDGPGSEVRCPGSEGQWIVASQTPPCVLPLCNLQRGRVSRILTVMEIHFTPEQEAQLTQIATQEGTDAERLVKDAAVRLLEEDARFRAAEGIAQADRGEFIEEEEMTARLEQMLRS